MRSSVGTVAHQTLIIHDLVFQKNRWLMESYCVEIVRFNFGTDGNLFKTRLDLVDSDVPSHKIRTCYQ